MIKTWEEPEIGALIYVAYSCRPEDAVGPFLVIGIIRGNAQIPKDDYLYQILTQVIYLCHDGKINVCSLSKVFIGDKNNEKQT